MDDKKFGEKQSIAPLPRQTSLCSSLLYFMVFTLFSMKRFIRKILASLFGLAGLYCDQTIDFIATFSPATCQSEILSYLHY